MQDQEIVLKAAQKLYDRKAFDIAVLKTGHLTILCDYMLLASGRTENQVAALARDVDEVMAEAGVQLRRSEGVHDGRWVVLDYGSILIHLFHRDERAFYRLDKLWNDGTNLLDLPFDQSSGD